MYLLRNELRMSKQVAVGEQMPVGIITKICRSQRVIVCLMLQHAATRAP